MARRNTARDATADWFDCRRDARRVGDSFQALEVRAYIGGAAVPKLPVLLQRLVDDGLELRRHVRVDARRRRRLPIEELIENHCRRLATEGRMPGRHLVQDDAEREQVCSRVQLLSSRLLGRHVGHRSERHPAIRHVLLAEERCRGIRRLGGRPRQRRQLRETKVEHLGLSAPGDEDVGRFDVAMDDACRMGRVERVGNLNREIDQPIQG